MLHVATTHLQSPRWIEIQTRHLREHLQVPYRTWASVQLMDQSYGSHFDRVIDQKGPDAGKLNHLALEIAQEADDEDLLMFLGADAFPITDPMPTITKALTQAPLLAVRKAENAGDPQPHPCFCVTTVGAWRELSGDWSDGYAWRTADGRLVTDVGANLLRRLDLGATPWVALRRSNPQTLDPLFFAVYGEIVYHHGAAPGPLSRAHLALAPSPAHASPGHAAGAVRRRLSTTRRRSWERRTRRRYMELSDSIYAKIKAGDSDWLAEVAPAARPSVNGR